MIGLIRRFYLVVLLVLAVAVPYSLVGESSGPIRDKIRNTVQAVFASRPESVEAIEGIDDPAVNRLLAMQQQLSANGQPGGSSDTLTPVVSLEGVLRFDVNPRWVMQNWPHVSTSRIDGPLDGLRVPLITGTNPGDAVGSLTYYFDKQQVVQRIAMDGIMGDDRNIVGIVTRVFQLKPEPQAGVGVYVSKWNGKPVSALWVRRLPVVHTNDGTQQYEFLLELNRSNNYGGLSARPLQRLQQGQASLGNSNVVR